MSKTVAVICLLVFLSFLAGCGETVRGIGRDASRIAYGVKTIFVSGK